MWIVLLLKLHIDLEHDDGWCLHMKSEARTFQQQQFYIQKTFRFKTTPWPWTKWLIEDDLMSSQNNFLEQFLGSVNSTTCWLKQPHSICDAPTKLWLVIHVGQVYQLWHGTKFWSFFTCAMKNQNLTTHVIVQHVIVLVFNKPRGRFNNSLMFNNTLTYWNT